MLEAGAVQLGMVCFICLRRCARNKFGDDLVGADAERVGQCEEFLEPPQRLGTELFTDTAAGLAHPAGEFVGTDAFLGDQLCDQGADLLIRDLHVSRVTGCSDYGELSVMGCCERDLQRLR